MRFYRAGHQFILDHEDELLIKSIWKRLDSGLSATVFRLREKRKEYIPMKHFGGKNI